MQVAIVALKSVTLTKSSTTSRPSSSVLPYLSPPLIPPPASNALNHQCLMRGGASDIVATPHQLPSASFEVHRSIPSSIAIKRRCKRGLRTVLGAFLKLFTQFGDIVLQLVNRRPEQVTLFPF